MTDTSWQKTLSAAELSALLEYGESKESNWSIELVRQTLDIPHNAAGTIAAGVASLKEKELISLSPFGTLDVKNSSINTLLPYLWDIQDALSFVMLGEGRKMTGTALRSNDPDRKTPVYIFAAGGGMFSIVPAVSPLTNEPFTNYGSLASSVYEQFISLLDRPLEGFAMAMTYHSPETVALVNAHLIPDVGWETSVSAPDYTLTPEMRMLDVNSPEELGDIVLNGPFKAFSLA